MKPNVDANFPLREFLSMDLAIDDAGAAIARLEVGDQHLSPNGAVHGGVLFTLVDTAMGRAIVATLDDGQMCATIEIQIRFLRPVGGGDLSAEATIVRRGSRIVHLESRVVDGAGVLVATATGTFAVMSPQTIPARDR